MGLKRMITKMIFKDTRGMNPNSMANLKQGRDPSPSPAPPPSPAQDPAPSSRSPPSFQQAQSFFEQMQQYEAWKMQVYQAEEARRRSIYQEAFEAAREEIGEEESDGSGIEETLIKTVAPILINKFAAAQGGTPASMAINPPNTPPSVEESAPPSMSREDARRLIDSFAKQKPKLLKDVRSGKYSKEEVLSFLSLQGIPRENAEILYIEAMTPQDGS